LPEFSKGATTTGSLLFWIIIMNDKTLPKLPDTIQTERLFLRAPNMADAPALHHLANNKYIHEMLARLPHPYTRAHAVDFITSLARTKSEHAYAIITDDDDFIGVAGLHLDPGIGLELGYWLGQPYWGKGYATEATRVLVQAAADCGQTEIFARAKSANTGSIGVLEKIGFQKTTSGVGDCCQHKAVPLTHFMWQSDRGGNDG
jgi:RimJ/RimL family protein N-acetyltransferase